MKRYWCIFGETRNVLKTIQHRKCKLIGLGIFSAMQVSSVTLWKENR